jgi:serine/threonine-protein kinase
VDKPFFIDTREVSTADYEGCVKAGRCVQADRLVVSVEAARVFGGTPESLADWGPRCNAVRNRGDHPINCVNHGSARDYCRYAAKRLPTAAEWGRAAGIDAGRRFPWGDTQPECTTACFDLQQGCLNKNPVADEVATCPVGSHPGDVTPEGVFDLGGGVAEWVAGDAPGAQAGSGEPVWRFAMGGSFHDGLAAMAPATKRPLPPVTAFVSIGFRCAQDAPSSAAPAP